MRTVVMSFAVALVLLASVAVVSQAASSMSARAMLSRIVFPADLDWRESGGNLEGLIDSQRSHGVRLSPDGDLVGKISMIDPDSRKQIPMQYVEIRFLQENRVVQSTRPNADGEFAVSELKPGVYALIADGPGGFLASSVHVMPALGADDGEIAQTDELALDISVVPSGDADVIRSLIEKYVPSNVNPIESVEPAVENIQKVKSVVKDKSPAASSTSFLSHQVYLQPDGSLIGLMQRLHPESGQPLLTGDMKVFLIQENRIVAEQPLNESGTFEFVQTEPGVYSLATAGSAGFAAYSVKVLPSPEQAGLAAGKKNYYVSLTQPPVQLATFGAIVGAESLSAISSIASIPVNAGLSGIVYSAPAAAAGAGGAAAGAGAAAAGAGSVAAGAGGITAGVGGVAATAGGISGGGLAAGLAASIGLDSSDTAREPPVKILLTPVSP